jgi:hypothetical protein
MNIGRGAVGFWGASWRLPLAAASSFSTSAGVRWRRSCIVLSNVGAWERVQPLDFQGVRLQRLDRRAQNVQCSPAIWDASPRRVVECPNTASDMRWSGGMVD